jgi:hypothetical protein
VLSIAYFDLDRLAGIIASAGSAAVALDPPELVEAVVARLQIMATDRTAAVATS